MSTPEQIIASPQANGDRRSAVYWRGALDVLRSTLAYFSGNDMGHALWRLIIDQRLAA